jgi:subtilase family serine protease
VVIGGTDVYRDDNVVNYCRVALGLFLFVSTAVTAAIASPAAGVPQTAVRDLGRAPAATPIRLTVVLNYRHEAELERFVEQLDNPAFGFAPQPLTAEQFREIYAPSEADYAQTLAALQRLGLRATHLYANRTVIDVTASAAVVERAFSARIENVRRADGSIGYASATPIALPFELQRTVLGIAGFDNAHFNTFNRRGRRSSAKPGPLQGPDTGLGPIAIERVYDMGTLHGYDGTGQAAGVVIDADYLNSDLAKYLKFFKVTRTGPPTIRVPIDGGPPPGLSYDSTETTLDVETIVGTAPGVALYVYEMPQIDSASILDAYNQVNSDDKVGAVNSSFGMCETNTDQKNFPQLADKLALQGAALGITYAAASGDSGTTECEFAQPGGVSSPASSSNIVAVGGTTLLLKADGTRISELGWYDSGGGQSAVFKMPDYQKGTPRATGSKRIVPDIAFDADPSSGTSFFINGGWNGPTGGTSLASPIFTAVVSELAQFNHKRIGNAHNLLYGRFKNVAYGAANAPQYFDAVGASNGYWYATKGFDAVTGIGSMDAWNFMNKGKAPAGVADSASSARTAVVTLKYHHSRELAKLIDTSTDPFSPMYGHFVTAQQFRAYFAPTPAEYAATVSALRNAGFGVTRTWDNRTIVDVTLPARSSHAILALPNVDRVVENSAAGNVTRNLHGAPHAQPMAAGTGYGPDGGFGPSVLAQALDFPTLHGFNGKGSNVADIIDGAPLEADIALYLKTFGIARTGGKTTVIPVNTGTAPDTDLADIDAEWLVSMAPGAKFYVYQMPVYDNVNLLDAYTKVVSDNIADVANISLSRAENNNVDMALSLVPIFQQGAAEGITFEDISFGGVSAGLVPNRLFPLIPADMADGIAVGAVNAITSGGKIVAISGMPNSGGGVSELFPVFKQQKAVKGVNQSGRNTPDMSVVSEINGNSASLYFEGSWGGNFLFTNATPIASLIAEYKQMTGHRLGAFDRTLYRLYASAGYKNGITDITTGCNGTKNGRAICAKPGYDITSGIGSFTDTYSLGQRLKGH